MGATATTTNPADFANRIQTYFNPKLLKALLFNLVLAQYGQQKDFPAIGTTIRFFRPRAASKAGVAAIVEGVTPTNKTEVAVGYVDVPLAQRGALAEVTDVVQAIDLLDTVGTYTTTMGGDAALDFDTVVRDALIAGVLNSGTTYTYGPTATQQGYPERFAGVVPTGVSLNDFNTCKALGIANAKMTRTRHLLAVTQLKAARIPTIGGKYVAAVSPIVMNDVRADTDWLTAAQRVDNAAGLYKNAQIELDGAVFVENDNSFIEDVYGTYGDTNLAGAGNGSVYTTLYLGAEAFGVPGLANKRAGGSPMGPRIVVLAAADKADPLNLKTSIAWKSFYGAKPFITNVAGEFPHYVALRTKASFI